jgi:cell division protein FtsB
MECGMLRLILKILWTQSLLVLWLGVLVAVAGTWAYWKRDIITSYFESRELRNQTRIEVQTLRKDVKRQEEERNSLSKDSFLSEKAAREIYYMSKPGEKVLFIETPSDSPTSSSLKKE